MFYNCPHFKHLRGNDLKKGGGLSDDIEDLTTKGTLKLKTLDKKSEELDNKKKKLKSKRSGKKNDPSVKKVREHLKKIIKYHEHKVNEEIPSVYPLLGPANSDSDNDDGKQDEKRERTKKEMKIYDPNKRY